MEGMSSLLLYLNSASCLPVLRLALLFLAFYAAIRLTRQEAPPRRTRRRHRQALNASGCGEDQLEGACQSPGTCRHAPLEKLTLAHSLRLVEERIQDVARYLGEDLIPPSTRSFARSSFSSSSWESSSSFSCSPSYVPLRDRSQSGSESPCHVGETVSSVGREGPSPPTQAQPPSRPPVPSQRDWPEQPAGRAQPSDSNICQKHLPSQLGPPPPDTESLAQVAPSRPARLLSEGHPRETFHTSRVPLQVSAEWEELVPLLGSAEWEELDGPVRTKRMQLEQDLPAPLKQPRSLLPPAPQPPTPGQPVLGERDTEQPWELLPALPSGGFLVRLPPPPRAESRCRRAQRSQEPCVCPSGSLPPRTPLAVPAPDTNLARPPQPPGEPGKGRAAESPEKLPLSVPAWRGGLESGETEADFMVEEEQETLGWHIQQQKLQQEWGRPDASWALVPKPCTSRPPVEVVPSLEELPFLESDARKRLEFHLVKMQVQQRWGLPRRVQDSLREFTVPAPGQKGRLSPPHSNGVAPYLSPLPPPSKKAQSGHWPPRAPADRRMDACELPTDTRRQLARSYSRKYPGAARGEERPAHRPAWQTAGQSASSSGSNCPPTPGQDIAMETGRSDGVAGSQASPGPCDLLAGAAPTSPPPGPDRTEQTLTATLHFHRSEAGAAGSGETLELHRDRRPRTPSPPRGRVPVFRRVLTRLRESFKGRGNTRPSSSHGACREPPEVTFRKLPFWRGLNTKSTDVPYQPLPSC